jgi:hypothetical protein
MSGIFSSNDDDVINPLGTSSSLPSLFFACSDSDKEIDIVDKCKAFLFRAASITFIPFPLLYLVAQMVQRTQQLIIMMMISPFMDSTLMMILTPDF